MAIDRTGINSLDAGAPNLRLEGDIASIQAIPIELQKIILQYWIQQGDGSSADRIEDVPKEFRDNIIQLFRQQSSAQGGMEPMSAAQGGRAGFKRGRVVEPGGYGGDWADEDWSWSEPSSNDHAESFPDNSSPSDTSTDVSWSNSSTEADTSSSPDNSGGESGHGEGLEYTDPRLTAGQLTEGDIGLGLNAPVHQDRILRIREGVEPGYRAQDERPYGYPDIEIAYREGAATKDEFDKYIDAEPELTLDRLQDPIYTGTGTGGGTGGGGVQFTDGTGPLATTATTAATTPATTTTPAGDYTSATMPFGDYYVGGAPTTAQEAFMQASGAVPEAVGRDVWARGGRIGYGLGDIVRRNRAKFGAPRRYEDEDEEDYPWNMARGGRAGYAGGGISDLRQGFLFGGIGRKIKKGVKKLIKSDIGKAALMYAATAGLGNLAAGAGAGTGAAWGVPWGSAAAGRGWLHPSMVASNIGTGFSGLKEGASNILGLGKTADETKLAVELKKAISDGRWKDVEIIEKLIGKGKVPGWATAASLGAMTLPYIFPDLGKPDEDDDAEQQRLADLAKWRNQFKGLGESFRPVGASGVQYPTYSAQGGRIGAQEGGLMNLGGMEKDYRQEGGFVPIGGQEKADDVPARLSKNEFVFTADAVRAAGGGDIDAGAEVMENVMENLEQGGQVSEESQGLEGARDMFATAQRLEGVM